MDEAKIEIAIWAGIPLLLLIVFSVAMDDSKALNAKNRKLNGLAKQYETYYLNPKADVPFEQALARAEQEINAQQIEFDKIKERACPELPKGYTVTNYTKASARATEDIEAIRKLAERSGVGLPAALPNANALEVEEAAFTKQLRQLYLFRNAAEMMIRDASSGKLDIIGVNVGQTFTDQSGDMAVFQMDFTIRVDFRSLERMLRTFNNNSKGLAIRMFDIELPDSNRVVTDTPYMDVSMTISLCTKNEDAWGLSVLGDAAAQPAAGGGRRGRGGNL